MISILIPNYNRSKLILETLDSISKQTYKNWECIIVDDGSTDDSETKIQTYINSDPRFIFYKRPDELLKGPSSCRNFAFSKSKGSFVQFFDSDDIMHPEHLEEKIKNINENDFVVCKLQEFSGEFKDENSLKPEFQDIEIVENIFESFVTGEFYMLMMVAPLWKKESISPFMPFNENLHILEDHELYSRILFEKRKYSIINKNLIFYRVGLPSLLNRFYTDVGFGIESYIQAKKTVLKLTQSSKVKYSILKMTLALFRISLANKDFRVAKKCLQFCFSENLATTITLKFKLFRIYFLFTFVRVLKRGDTLLKPMFKI